MIVPLDRVGVAQPVFVTIDLLWIETTGLPPRRCLARTTGSTGSSSATPVSSSNGCLTMAVEPDPPGCACLRGVSRGHCFILGGMTQGLGSAAPRCCADPLGTGSEGPVSSAYNRLRRSVIFAILAATLHRSTSRGESRSARAVSNRISNERIGT